MFTKLFNKHEKKKYEFQYCYISIVLEDGWVEYVDKDKEKYGLPLSFFKEENGVGALQVSVTTSKDEKELDINKVFKKDEQSSFDVKKYKLKEWIIYEYEKNENERFLKSFYLVNPHVIVYATYNCGLENRNEKELNEAIKIVKTIDVISKN